MVAIITILSIIILFIIIYFSIEISLITDDIYTIKKDIIHLEVNKKKKMKVNTKDISKIKAKDINKNILNLFHINYYVLEDNKIILHFHRSVTQILHYKNNTKSKKMYKKFLKYEKAYNEDYDCSDVEDDGFFS